MVTDAEPVTRWYGWQTLLVDAGDVPLFFVLGPIPYLLGGPIVHFAHRQPGKGFGSLGLRVALPLALGGFGYAVSDDHCAKGLTDWQVLCDSPAVRGAEIGALIGGVGAIVLDAAFLANEDVATSNKPSVTRSGRVERPFHVAPDLQIGRGKGSFGLRGSF